MMKLLRPICGLLTVFCAGGGLSGCVPSRGDIVKEVSEYVLPADVTLGNGLIYIIDTTPSLLPIKRDVLLDGEDEAATIGSLLSGTYLYFSVLPGHHRIKMPQWSPYEVIVEVEEGDLFFFQTGVDRSKKNRLMQIDGVMGRYHVKRARSGGPATAPTR